MLLPSANMSGPADLRAQGVELTIGDGWLHLAQAADATTGVDGDLDAPGLWKRRGAQRVFDAPLAMADWIDLDIDGPTEEGLVAAIAEWALQTIGGGVPRGWSPPPRERLDEVVPAAALSFRSGPFLEAARLIADGSTLRVQVALGRLDPALPAARREWARELVAGTAHLRMVRVGIRDETAIEAAVDLTGAPALIAEALLPAAVHALRHCYAFLVPTATLIGDAGCASSVLDAAPSRIISHSRSRKT